MYYAGVIFSINYRPPKVEYKNTSTDITKSYPLLATQLHNILNKGESNAIASALEVIKNEESCHLKEPEIKSSHSLYIIIQQHQKHRFYKFINFTIKIAGAFNKTLNIPFSQLRYLLCIASLNLLVSEVSKKIEWNLEGLSNPNCLDFSRNAAYSKAKNDCYKSKHPDYFAQHIFKGRTSSLDISIE